MSFYELNTKLWDKYYKFTGGYNFLDNIKQGGKLLLDSINNDLFQSSQQDKTYNDKNKIININESSIDINQINNINNINNENIKINNTIHNDNKNNTNNKYNNKDIIKINNDENENIKNFYDINQIYET